MFINGYLRNPSRNCLQLGRHNINANVDIRGADLDMGSLFVKMARKHKNGGVFHFQRLKIAGQSSLVAGLPPNVSTRFIGKYTHRSRIFIYGIPERQNILNPVWHVKVAITIRYCY